jgi:hypothetical protein
VSRDGVTRVDDYVKPKPGAARSDFSGETLVI